MGGGALIPQPLACTEIEAWGRLTGHQPNPWEVQTLLAMDDAWRAAQAGGDKGGQAQHQGLGDYCRGEKVQECRAQLGAALETACRTCPN